MGTEKAWWTLSVTRLPPTTVTASCLFTSILTFTFSPVNTRKHRNGCLDGYFYVFLQHVGTPKPQDEVAQTMIGPPLHRSLVTQRPPRPQQGQQRRRTKDRFLSAPARLVARPRTPWTVCLFVFCLFLTWMHRHHVTASINLSYETSVRGARPGPPMSAQNDALTAVTATSDSPETPPRQQEKILANQESERKTYSLFAGSFNSFPRIRSSPELKKAPNRLQCFQTR